MLEPSPYVPPGQLVRVGIDRGVHGVVSSDLRRRFKRYTPVAIALELAAVAPLQTSRS